MPFGLGIWEIAILAGLLVLLFGTKGALGAAKGLGKGVREVHDAVKEVDPRRMLDPARDEPARAAPAAVRVAEPRVAEATPAAPVPEPAPRAEAPAEPRRPASAE
jgi:sec-independent protein translocase protein TatA